ncbi:NUDIX hydrolase [Streptomyces griseoaurantiacus]|uniref:NUDIX hydrolase n=1 Tax=Streptomyces griseoaurantiacus TaxID=68213 RepID=UPI000B87F8DB|nr:NUDIX hydrolase [Streptomyces jietaisiensis]
MLEREFFESPLLAGLRPAGWSSAIEYTASDAAIFLLGFQFFGHKLDIPHLDSFCLTEIADRAADDRDYRLLLVTGLRTIISDASAARAMATRIEERATVRFRVSASAGDVDHRLESRIGRASSDKLMVISTTSQVSGFLLNVLRRSEANISSVRLACLSPKIVTHSALTLQLSEASVPKDVIPVGQQMDEANFDGLRRVVRILTGMENIRTMFADSRMQVNFGIFTRRHPGLKLRLLSNAKYMQIFPGGLLYADNLYRFGYEITDAPLAEDLSHMFQEWLASECESVDSTGSSFEDLRSAAMTEIARFLLGTNDVARSVSAASSKLFSLLPEEHSRDVLRQTLQTLAQGLEATTVQSDHVRSAPSQWEVYVPPSGPIIERRRGLARTPNGAHISVGALIRSGGKTLAVKKVTAPNRGLWSIPAGHCEWGECPAISIVRELTEEIGTVPSEPRLIHSSEMDEGRPCRHGESRHLRFLYAIDLAQRPDVRLEAEELGEHRWVDDVAISRLRRTPAFTELLERLSSDARQ